MKYILSDDEIKLTPKSLKMAKPPKGLGYSFSSNAQKLNGGLDTKFVVGAVSTDDYLDKPVVVTLESRPTIQIVPSSHKTDNINVANGDGNTLIDTNKKMKSYTIINSEHLFYTLMMTSLLSFLVVHLEFNAKAKTITNIEKQRLGSLDLTVIVEQTKDQLIDFNQIPPVSKFTKL